MFTPSAFGTIQSGKRRGDNNRFGGTHRMSTVEGVREKNMSKLFFGEG